MGQLGILNVGAGDTKLSFDPTNPAECIRSGRIVKDMIRRGYALLIEVDDGDGGRKYTRARDFDEKVCEYIIADFDPEIAAKVDASDESKPEPQIEIAGEGPAAPEPKAKRDYTRRIKAESASGIAVARSAGG